MTEKPTQPLRQYLPWVVLCIGTVFSVVAVSLMPTVYHVKDWSHKIEWAQHFASGWRDIYINCGRCNYPIVGTLVTAGIVDVLSSVQQIETVVAYRLLLGVVDALNVLLLFWLLKLLGVRRSALWAGIVGVLPSSWVGGALWGQNDSFSHFFLMLALVCIAKGSIAARKRKSGIWLSAYLTLAGAVLVSLALTKQLAIFSFVALEGVILAQLWFITRRGIKAAAYFCLYVGWQAILVLIWDLFLHLPEPFVSHLAYIWLTGSGHMDKIAGNGFNLWIYLGWPQWGPSTEPFFRTLSPRDTGMVLFVSYVAVLTTSLVFRLVERYRADRSPSFDNELLADLVFFVGLVNLGFNVLLTGTHERYLYHFYPLAIAGCLSLGRHRALFSVKMLVALLFGAASYGAYVYEILTRSLSPALFLIKNSRFQAAFHLLLLCYLSLTYLQAHGLPPRLRRLVRPDQNAGRPRERPKPASGP